MPHVYLYNSVRRWWRRTWSFLTHRVLHVDDTPHRVALGVAVGCFSAWMPVVGLQMALVLVLSTLLRANKLVGLPFVWLSNPLTLVPVYYPSYRLGAALWPGWTHSPHQWQRMMESMGAEGLSPWQRIVQGLALSWDIAGPLWLGSLLLGLCVGGLAYWATYAWVTRHRRRLSRRRSPPVQPVASAAEPKGSPIG